MKKLMAVMLCGLVIIGAGCILDGTGEDGEFDGMDGNAGFMAKEVADMGRMSLTGMDAGMTVGSGKAAADGVVESNIVWDTVDGTWTRTADVTYPDGNATRYDSLAFTDASSNLVLNPVGVVIARIDHYHDSELTTNGGVVFGFVGDMDIDLTHGGTDYTSATKNGSGNFTMSGLDVSNSTVENVVYPKTAGEWGYPTSGTVTVYRPFRTIVIEFIGNNQARATVDMKLNSDSDTFLINLETGAEVEE